MATVSVNRKFNVILRYVIESVGSCSLLVELSLNPPIDIPLDAHNPEVWPVVGHQACYIHMDNPVT